jgi:hypothetical protein
MRNLMKLPNIKFNGNLFSGSGVFACRQMDWESDLAKPTDAVLQLFVFNM